MNNNLLTELAKAISDVIPEPLKQLGDDTQKQAHAIAKATLSKLDLVTREEFDVQSRVLAKTRKMVTELDARLIKLEGLHHEAEHSTKKNDSDSHSEDKN